MFQFADGGLGDLKVKTIGLPGFPSIVSAEGDVTNTAMHLCDGESTILDRYVGTGHAQRLGKAGDIEPRFPQQNVAGPGALRTSRLLISQRALPDPLVEQAEQRNANARVLAQLASVHSRRR